MEVVTANGRFVTASANSHPDLFWALRGGATATATESPEEIGVRVGRSGNKAAVSSNNFHGEDLQISFVRDM